MNILHNPASVVDEDELKRLRKTERVTFPITLALSLSIYAYVATNPEFAAYQTYVGITIITLNLFVLFFQLLIVPGKYYNKTASNIEAGVISIFAAMQLPWTGGFDSPFIFILYLILLSTPVNEIFSIIILCIVQITFLVFITLVTPEMFNTLLLDPIKAGVLLLSPAAVTYFTITMLYETLTQKRGKETAEKLSGLLSLEKAKLETVISSIGDTIIACNDKNTILLANNTLEKITPFRKIDVLGKNIKDVFPEIDISAEKKIQDVRFYRKDGVGVDCTIMINPLSDNIGRNVGKLIVIHDISKEKDLERMKLDFVSMAAHELRTPLTAIKGYVSFLLETLPQKITDEEAEFLRRISVSGDTLSSLVENILSLTHIERKTIKLDLKPTDIASVVENLLAGFKETAAGKSIEIANSTIGDIPNVLADKLRIGEVFSNLVDNAIKYTKKGKVTVKVYNTDTDVVVSVMDTGIGIPKEAQKHLFTKFYRVTGDLQSGAKGTGLGLYICKAIVEMHGGKIWAESNNDQGSTFYFSLPIRKVDKT
jgi:PAS domain S-box-containing protein